MIACDPPGAVAAADAAVAESRDLGPDALGEAARAENMAATALGDAGRTAEALPRYQHSLELDPSSWSNRRRYAVNYSAEMRQLGRNTRARDLALDGLDEMRRRGEIGGGPASALTGTAVNALLSLGDWETAAELVAAAAVHEEWHDVQRYAERLRWRMLLWRGELDAARPLRALLSRQMSRVAPIERQLQFDLAIDEAEELLADGRAERVLDVVGPVAFDGRGDRPDDRLHLLLCGARAAASLRATGADVEPTVRRIAAELNGLREWESAQAWEPLIVAELEADPVVAAERFEAAAEAMLAECGQRHLHAYALVRRAECLLATGERDELAHAEGEPDEADHHRDEREQQAERAHRPAPAQSSARRPARLAHGGRCDTARLGGTQPRGLLLGLGERTPGLGLVLRGALLLAQQPLLLGDRARVRLDGHGLGRLRRLGEDAERLLEPYGVAFGREVLASPHPAREQVRDPEHGGDGQKDPPAEHVHAPTVRPGGTGRQQRPGVSVRSGRAQRPGATGRAAAGTRPRPGRPG